MYYKDTMTVEPPRILTSFVNNVCNNPVEHKLSEFYHMLYDKLVTIKQGKETKWTGGYN